jgi:hypothetical protein
MLEATTVDIWEDVRAVAVGLGTWPRNDLHTHELNSRAQDTKIAMLSGRRILLGWAVTP